MRIKDGFVVRTVGDESMAVPVGARLRDVPGVIALSDTGAFLWRRLEQGASEKDLVDALTEAYEVEPERASRDVSAFVASLAANGWLEE